MEINTKSSQNAYEIYLMMKTGKKTTESSQKSYFFGQTYMEFDGCHGNVKNDGQIFGTPKFLRRMKEQPLKVSAPYIK